VGDGSKCYNDDPANCAKYGRLYTWATAMGIDAKYNNQSWNESDVKHRGICPSSWHIPSGDDWKELINYVESSNGCSACAAKYLKATSERDSNGNGEDKYGFSALPGGFGYSNGYFNDVGGSGYWWLDSESSSNYAYYWRMLYPGEDVYSNYYYKTSLYSVRCLQD